MKDQPNRHPAYFMNRRRFLKILGLSGITSFMAACQRRTPTETWSTEIRPLATRIPPPSIVPSVTPPVAASPTYTATPSPKAMAAIGQLSSYKPTLLRRELERMLSGIGGLSDLIKPGARVGIKANLTGGTWWDAKGKPPATEMFVTHPAVVGALGEMLLDMGAAHLAVMDGLGDEANFQKWGYIDMAKPLGAKLIDLCKPDQYVDFKSFPVGSDAYMYDQFDLNATLGEFDVIISVAKMKCHSTTGVTLSLKNMIGLAPISRYRRNEDDNNRSAFHDTEAFDKRLPRVAIDLNRAVPVDFAVIDGVITVEGGAGPWNAEMTQIKPGLLVASADPVAADAVAAALMGFDPASKSGSAPFVNGENHLALAYDSKLGTNRLMEIGIAGPAIKDVACMFKPAG
jgi:uncharacterized protein (DUF362 family)